MPGFDGTGPRGTGPMTGRGMGYCVVPLPRSRTLRPAEHPSGGRYSELANLKNKAQLIKDQIKQIEAMIKVLENVTTIG
ncbi:MAG: DUF5320 domain-containing protein [Chloroflexota bacterium]|nr:DUF5320 domain-containing protein [Chloroflexota bacterium]